MKTKVNPTLVLIMQTTDHVLSPFICVLQVLLASEIYNNDSNNVTCKGISHVYRE